MNKEANFVLEVGFGFNSYKFFEEFKKLQHKGHFKGVQRVRKLDKVSGVAKDIKEGDDVFTIHRNNAESYGVKYSY